MQSVAEPGAKILLVEDDIQTRAMLAIALRRDGYDVVEAADGNAALEWLGPGVLEGRESRLPAAIVSDVRLPRFSGLEVLQGTRLAKRHIPVVIITGFGDPDTHARARELGADCVLDKPFDSKTLRAVIRRLVGWAAEPAAPAVDGHVL
jgi:DNA-binding response OmpR family regulator